MIKINIAVGQKIYSLECQDENSASVIQNLAKSLNKKVNDVLQSISNIDNTTAIVFSAILLLNQIDELNKKLETKPEKTKDLTNKNEYDLFGNSCVPKNNNIIEIEKDVIKNLLLQITQIEEKVKNIV